jgi:hypothetical protein
MGYHTCGRYGRATEPRCVCVCVDVTTLTTPLDQRPELMINPKCLIHGEAIDGR